MAQEEEIQEGDTVMLKSGGPIMTVNWVSKSGQVECVWFDGNQPMTLEFLLTSLKKVNPEDYED